MEGLPIGDTTPATPVSPRREPDLAGQTVVPIGRVIGPADVAALAVHIMTNTALTGATYDIDGGQQFVS